MLNERLALLPLSQCRGHPIDRNIRPPCGQFFGRVELWPARLDHHREPGVAIKPFRGGDVVAGELRLRQPFQLQEPSGSAACAEPPPAIHTATTRNQSVIAA